MAVTSFVLLESGMTAKEALRRINQVVERKIAIVRRRLPSGSVWHRFSVDSLRVALELADADTPISEILTFDALNEVPEIDAAITPPPHQGGVLMQNGQVIGVSTAPAGGFAAFPMRSPSATLESEGIDGGGLEGSADGQPDHSSPEASLDSDPAFSAYGHIDSPRKVAREQEFDVQIGVSAERSETTQGDKLMITDLPPDVTVVEIDVQVVTGFDVIKGEPAARLEVNRQTLEHEPLVLRVAATTPPAYYEPDMGYWVERVTAVYSYQGATIGTAWTDVLVDASRTGKSFAAETAELAKGAPPLLHAAVHNADITLVIDRGGDSMTGPYSFVIHSPHLGPSRPEYVNLGSDPQTFAGGLIKEIGLHIMDPVSDEAMAGVAADIADKMPEAFWKALADVTRAVGEEAPEGQRRLPTVLLLTDDCYVPWELARLPEPIDPERPNFLGAQTYVGRWPLASLDKLSAEPLNLEAMAVVIGQYEGRQRGGPERLEQAEREGDLLEERFNMRKFDADVKEIDRILSGKVELQDRNGSVETFEFKGIHFAGHGMSDPEDEASYITMSNGKDLSPYVFREPKIADRGDAFLFINACQVGTSYEALGEYAGVAGKAVRAGFRGFVAPLWSVLDTTSRKICLEFYEAAAAKRRVAEYLHEKRGLFRQVEGTDEYADATYLAYVFYGHPDLTLGGPPKR